MVEGARLESVYTGNCIASSNLAVSAKNEKRVTKVVRFFVDTKSRNHKEIGAGLQSELAQRHNDAKSQRNWRRSATGA